MPKDKTAVEVAALKRKAGAHRVAANLYLLVRPSETRRVAVIVGVSLRDDRRRRQAYRQPYGVGLHGRLHLGRGEGDERAGSVRSSPRASTRCKRSGTRRRRRSWRRRRR